jgi:DNA-binding MarR family transcriptional regulator
MRERAADMLRDFYLRSHRAIDRLMAGEGASYARARLLMHIARDGPLRSVEIASSFGHAPRTVTEAIDGLERDGLVRRTADPSDRRAKLIAITDAGRIAIKGAVASKQRYIDAVFGALSPDECGEMVRLVGKLTDRIEAVATTPSR